MAATLLTKIIYIIEKISSFIIYTQYIHILLPVWNEPRKISDELHYQHPSLSSGMAAVFPLVKYGFKQRLDTAYNASVMCLAFLFFFFFVYVCVCVEKCVLWLSSGSRALFMGPTNLFFLTKLLLKMGLTSLFTYLKIILLQFFQFSVFSKINCI